MAFIRPADQETLRARFEQELQGDVHLVLFGEPPTGLYVPGRQESQTGRQAQLLMEELAELSPKLHLHVHNPRLERELAERYGVEETPALILERAESADGRAEAADGGPGQSTANGQQTAGSAPPSADSGGAEGSKEGTERRGLVRFLGLPAGYEFMTLIEDLVDISRGQTRLSDATRQAVARLPEPVHLQVFVTPT